MKSGWDWNLIPGATTLQLPLQDLAIGVPPARRKHRSFSDRTFCAGLRGPDGWGVFGLDLHDNAFPGSLEARKSVIVAGTDRKSATLVQGLRKVIQSDGLKGVKVLQRSQDVYLSK